MLQSALPVAWLDDVAYGCQATGEKGCAQQLARSMPCTNAPISMGRDMMSQVTIATGLTETAQSPDGRRTVLRFALWRIHLASQSISCHDDGDDQQFHETALQFRAETVSPC